VFLPRFMREKFTQYKNFEQIVRNNPLIWQEPTF
jgi:hypothetical protein